MQMGSRKTTESQLAAQTKEMKTGDELNEWRPLI